MQLNDIDWRRIKISLFFVSDFFKYSITPCRTPSFCNLDDSLHFIEVYILLKI